MPYNTDKLIMAFTDDRLGSWLKAIGGTGKALSIEEPISVFVSFTFESEDVIKKANLVSYLKEIVATLVFERIIKNTQQVTEIGIEKKLGRKQEVNIFLQQS